MASRNRAGTTVAPGAPPKLLPRKGKDGFVADNVFAISSVVPEEVRAGVEVFETLEPKWFRRCLQIASRIASGDTIDERLLSETGISSHLEPCPERSLLRFLTSRKCSHRSALTTTSLLQERPRKSLVPPSPLSYP